MPSFKIRLPNAVNIQIVAVGDQGAHPADAPSFDSLILTQKFYEPYLSRELVTPIRDWRPLREILDPHYLQLFTLFD